MNDPKAIISVNDPAIETERITVEQAIDYFKTRDYSKIAPFLKPGGKPTVFHVRPVPHALWEPFIATAVGEYGQLERCFRAGVVEVDNVYQGDALIEGRCELSKKREHGENVLTQEAVNAHFHPGEIEEIGSVIRHMSFLARRMRGPFPLPPMCLAILSARDFLPADAQKNSPEKLSAAASPEQTVPPTPGNATTSESGSAAPTVATATGTPMEFASTPS